MFSLNIKSNKLPRHVKIAALLLSLGTASYATTVSVTVSGNAGPWLYASGGLNSAYQYGVDDETAPAIVNTANGLSFMPGNDLTIQYLSGQVSAGSGFPYVDGNGDTAAVSNNGRGSSGQVDPSYYMNPSTYPIYLTELVGTFANSSGAIVGTPFAVGDGPLTLAIPTGATTLQLGVNDDIYFDNSGSFIVSVVGSGSAPTVPEPATVTYFSAGLVGASLCLRRRRALKIVPTTPK